MKRMRGRGHRPNGGGGGGFRNQQNGIPLNRNHVFDSSGPEMRVRGTAQQLYDKYTQLARDAAGGGDRILGEAYYQHAEHYFRIISAINQAQNQPNAGQGGPQPPREGGEGTAEEPREGGRAEQQPRRFEPRQRPEFQPRNHAERGERNERGERPFRTQPQILDTPIDISSALEAELEAAASGAPPGVKEQPAAQQDLPMSAPEPRAIPIIPDAPPPAVTAKAEAEVEAEANAPEAPPAPRPRPRGRPRSATKKAE